MMNTIDQKDGNTTRATGVSRRSILMVGVASLVGCRVKPDIILYNFQNGYFDTKTNFDSFIVSAMRDHSALWTEENGYKKLTVENKATGNSYNLRIAGDTIVIFVKSKTEEIHFSYVGQSGQITGPAGKNIKYFSDSLAEIQSLLHEQGVSF